MASAIDRNEKLDGGSGVTNVTPIAPAFSNTASYSLSSKYIGAPIDSKSVWSSIVSPVHLFLRRRSLISITVGSSSIENVSALNYAIISTKKYSADICAALKGYRFAIALSVQ